MKKYIACIVIVLLVIVSCKQEAIPKPDNLLSKERMAAILYDITMVNSIKGINNDKLKETDMHLDTYLYKKHDIDSAQFQNSNNYYAAKPAVYSEIYAIVQARLTEERKIVGEKLEAEQKRRDSIQEAKKISRETGEEEMKGKLKAMTKKQNN